MMRQVTFEGHGGPDVIRIGEAPVPEPGPGQVLIEVAAAGVNRPDCLQREGVYPPPPGESDIPGLEIAGRVVARGEGVRAPREGDYVCALVGSGGYAEYALAHASLCLPVPKASGSGRFGWPSGKLFHRFRQCVYTWQARARRDIARAWRIERHRFDRDPTRQAARRAGHRHRWFEREMCVLQNTWSGCLAIDYKTQDFVEEVRKIAGKHGVDVVLDMVGGTYLQKNLSVLAAEGRLVQIGFLQSAIAREFRFTPVMLRRLTLTGSTLRARTVAPESQDRCSALRKKSGRSSKTAW